MLLRLSTAKEGFKLTGRHFMKVRTLMNYEELKTAFAIEKPVTYDGVVYKCVSAIIWRKDKTGKRVVRAELQDQKVNSVTIATPDRIEYFDGEIKNGSMYVGKE